MTTKFRAWLVDEKRMLHEGEIHSILLDGGKPFMLHVGYFKDGRSVDKYVDLGPKCVLMQSAGFGKEIYEGDIVKFWDSYRDAEGDVDCVPVVGEVKYDAESMSWYFTNRIEGSMEDILDGEYPVTVIGNIYENPELLEEEK